MNTPFNEAAENEFRDQLAALRKDFANLSRTAADNVAETVGAAGHRTADSARAARASVVGAVVEHPLAAIGLAAALGYLLAMMTRR